MARIIKFDIEIDNNGEAIIRLPEGPGQQKDAAEVASLTEKIAKFLGRIKERHIGKHHHHDTTVEHLHEKS